jgi:hypothetical protein
MGVRLKFSDLPNGSLLDPITEVYGPDMTIRRGLTPHVQAAENEHPCGLRLYFNCVTNRQERRDSLSSFLICTA